MKTLKIVTVLLFIIPCLALPLSGNAAEDRTEAKPKPDNLTTCPVSGDKLSEMGKPVVFVYQGQEVKLCCKGCKKKFDKDPAKYLKKIEAAAEKEKK